MEKIYDPKLIESKWRDFWEKNNCFKTKDFDPDVNADPNVNIEHTNKSFCIMLPPPNVTGNLHMGHAFQHTIMDALIRFNRMLGKATLWQPGMDHAGISTQMVVERQLMEQNIKRTDLSREDFVAKVWQWKEQYGGIITKQMKRVGTSIDWSIAKFTLDPDFCSAVRKVFVQLYKDGLIYKGQKLINWDPILQTAISDLEVVSEEVPGNLWYIKYPIANSQDCLTIATTRPETLLGDVAVCVNPSDARYQDLIGKYVVLPIVNKKIPIIADSYVDQDFGTGCLKITPAHDWNDYAIASRHNLPLVNIFTKAITLNSNVPTEYQGLDKLTARKKILADLQKQNLLLKTEDYILKVPKSTNTNAVVEPFLTDQWFVKMEELAKPAIEAVQSGRIKFVPQEWSNNYLEWLNNIQDWCISRQLWWGHQIPAWYDDSNNIYVAENEQEVRRIYGLANNIKLTQEQDVLDTWFSAALWPFVTLGWPEKTIKLQNFFPTSVLVTGFDIIFFWVARMVMFSLKFTDQIPFETVYIHGIIQDQDGQKMSKSKGNVIDPIDLVDGISLPELIVKRTTGLMQPQLKNSIEQKTKQQFPDGINCFGTDALRFTFCAIATHSRHIKFELLRLEGYRNFCNKLWNAARFVLLHIKEQKFDLTTLDVTKIASNHIREQWILSIWQTVKQNIIDHFANYRFDLVSKDIYEFVWNEYCDWYLEFAKSVLIDPDKPESIKDTTKLVLIFILDEVLKVLHPIMPYITEEIWQTINLSVLYKNKLLDGVKSEQFLENILINTQYPKFDQKFINNNAEQSINWVKKFITTIRNLRASMNVALGIKLPVVFVDSSLINIEKEFLLSNQDLIKIIAKINTIIITDDLATKQKATVAVVNQTEIWVQMEGLIDNDFEIARLNKEINKLQKQLEAVNIKLNNPQYLNNAPQEIVVKEQQKQSDLQTTIAKLQANIKVITQV